MKKALLLLTFISFSTLANQVNQITCDHNKLFGLGMLTRVDFMRTERDSFLMTVYKERQSDCCRYLEKISESTIELVEDINHPHFLVTPYYDNTGSKIQINTSFGKCRIQTADKFKFKGNAISVNGNPKY